MALAVYEGETAPQGDYIAVNGNTTVTWYAECGASYSGETVLCDTHQQQAQAAYPQGWRAYPGDTCKHGVYVGGCGVDWMCMRCELGEEDE